jgi:HEAT repeat protein
VTIGKLAVQPLVGLLADANPEVRWRAIVALGWIGDTEAVEPLLVTLNDRVWEVRQNAAWALGQIGDHLAAEYLFTAMHDEDEQVCVLAAYALARMNDGAHLQSGSDSDNECTWRAASAGLSLLAHHIAPMKTATR